MQNFQFIFWLIMALLGLFFVPLVTVWAGVQHFRGRGSERTGSGGISAGIGAAIQKLDRLMARPSAEFQMEMKSDTLKREDDSGAPQRTRREVSQKRESCHGRCFSEWRQRIDRAAHSLGCTARGGNVRVRHSRAFSGCRLLRFCCYLQGSSTRTGARRCKQFR
jgi:hypothetical protein